MHMWGWCGFPAFMLLGLLQLAGAGAASGYLGEQWLQKGGDAHVRRGATLLCATGRCQPCLRRQGDMQGTLWLYSQL